MKGSIMKHVFRISIVVSVLFCCSCQKSESCIDSDLKTKATEVVQEEPNAKQWFAEAGLGMFIHWGISASDPCGSLEISWSMITGWAGPQATRTPVQYWKLADDFKAENYDPDNWMKAAKEAGFRYAVLTAKHHDGYALWPSEYGSYSTKQHLGRRDLVKEYVEACRKNGLKVGLYFSPADWYYNQDYMSFRLGTEGFDLWAKTDPNGSPVGIYHEDIELKKMPDEWTEKFKDFMRGQVIELLTNYGKIDLLWFDYNFRPDHVGITMDEIRAISPGTIVNHRLHGHGDFLTYELALPKEKPPKDTWEACTLMGAGWAHRKDERQKPFPELLEWFVKTRAMGGNLLLNVAPRPDGTLPDGVYERFDQFADWLKVHKESVFGTQGGYWNNLSNYPVTMRDKIWYVHLVPSIEEPIHINSDKIPEKIRLMRTKEKISWNPDPNGFTIDLDPAKRTEPVEVLKIKWK